MRSTPEIIGLGYCGLDYLSIVPEIPLDDKVEIIESLIQGGGPAATATYAAARLGASSAFTGSVGADERGKEIIAGMTSGGVNTKSLTVRDKGESPAAFCWTEATTGKRSIMWTRGTAAPLSKDEVDVELIKNAKVLHLDGHQMEAALYAAKIARANGVTVSLDAGTLVPKIERLIELSDIIIASEKFAAKFTEETDPEIAVKKLFAENCKFSAITLGSAGCVGFDGCEIFRVPSFKVDVIDTTGAGDVFHGAFAYKYINGGSWLECAKFASAVSALKCTKFGGRTGIPTLAETKKFLLETS
jgi:sulfofructose kinase